MQNPQDSQDLDIAQLVSSLVENKKIKRRLHSAEVWIKIIEYISGAIYAQKSVEWHEMRSYTIGGSEIGNLIHEGKYSGFYHILMDRYAKEQMTNGFNCAWGNFFEEVTRLVFEKTHDVTVLETGSIEGFCYPQRFSPDGLTILADGTPVLCEFKTPVARNYVDGYISDMYHEQVYTGLLTFYSKYKIRAKGMFMDCFLKTAHLDQLKWTSRACCFDVQCVYTGKSWCSFGNGLPIHMGLVEIVPKDREAFIEFLINSKGSCGWKVLTKKELVAQVATPTEPAVELLEEAQCGLDLDDCICEGACICGGLLEEDLGGLDEVAQDVYTNKKGEKFPKASFEGQVDILRMSLLCDLFGYIYGTKDRRDDINRKILLEKPEGDELAALQAQLETMQDITLVYHPLDSVVPQNDGFFVGYKVFKTNNVTIELDNDKILDDIEYRTECVAHMKTLMDAFNEYIADCKAEGYEVEFNRVAMKAWLSKAAKGGNDCREVDVEELKDALYDNMFSSLILP